MRVFITIICLLGGMLHAEGRGYASKEERFFSCSIDVSVSDGEDTLFKSAGFAIISTRTDVAGIQPPPTLQIDTGTSKICQLTNTAFVARKPSSTINYTKVIWNFGEPGINPNNVEERFPAGTDDKWMNSGNSDYPAINNKPRFQFMTIGEKRVSITFVHAGGSDVYFADIYVHPKPNKPVPRDESFCLGGTSTALTAVISPNHTPIWYQLDATGTYREFTGPRVNPFDGPTPPTTPVGNTTYRVSQQNIYGCESDIAELKVNILSAPTTPPTANDPSYCEGETATPLSITSTLPASTEVAWYDIPTPSTGYPALSSAPIPGTSTADVGNKNYYVRIESTIACGVSPMTTVRVTVNPKPAAPVVPALTACQNGIVNLPSTIPSPPAGQDVLFWGSNANGGTPSVPTLPSTSSPGSQTFYVSFRNSTTLCQSARTPITLTIHPLPDANIIGSAIICQNASAPLTLQASGGLPPNYTFTYEEAGSPSSLVTATADATGRFMINNISTANPGNKTIRLLSVTDGRCTNPLSNKTAVITIKPNPSAVMSLNNPTVCEGDPAPQITFTGSGGTGSGPYTFTYGVSSMAGNQTIASGTSGTVNIAVNTSSPISSLTYELKGVSYTDLITCSTPYTGISHSVTIHPKPNISVAIDGAIDPNPRYCQSSVAPTLRFTAPTGKSPFTFTYTTQTGSGAPVTSTADPLATPTMSIPTSTPGITKYTPVNIKDANGCVRTLTGVLTVEILPTPSATITASTPAVCQNDPVAPSVLFTGSVGPAAYTPAYLFEYDINGVNKTPITSATGNNTKTETLQTSTVGTFVYTLKKVSYTIGTTTCSFDPVSSSATIKVNPLPTATLTGPSASILICKDGSRPALTFYGDIGRPPYTFDFTRNGLAQSVSGSPSYTEKVSTSIVGNIQYRLTGVTDANGCRQAATGSVDIEVAPIPTVNAGPDVWIMSGQKAVLKATAGNANGLLFAWSPVSLVDDPTKLQPAATPLSTTRFTLTVRSDKGCENTDDVLVTVLLRPEIPNTFTPNGDGANDRWDIPNLSSYPNAIVEVYNTAGQAVFRSTGFYTPWDGTRNGRPLPVGTYYYVINTNFNNEKRSGFITLLR